MKVAGVNLDQHQFIAAENAAGPSPFTLREFQSLLEASDVPQAVSYEAAKRHLQHLRRTNQARFDTRDERWYLLKTLEIMPPSLPTLPLEAVGWTVSETVATAESSSPWHRLQRFFTNLLMLVACLGSVGALVLINASFAWEFAETELFRWALVAAFIASDLLRPLIVTRALFDLGKLRMFRGIFGLLIALLLAPLSVLSSSTVISATMQLGEEVNQQAAEQTQTRALLRDRVNQLNGAAARYWQEYQAECDRGGCGPLAAEIAQQAKATEREVRDIYAALEAQSTEVPKATAFVARTVDAYKALGLFSESNVILLPLLIALTLELAALFGPALLLARRR